MSGFAVKGWCPDAWRPMPAGDGLLVRIRPPFGRLSAAQATGLCAAVAAHACGPIEITARASLQIRGVPDHAWRDLVAALVALDLVDPDPVREARRAIMVAPDWCEGDDSHLIATALLARLGDLPDMPGKIGFAIDAGPAPILADASADFRIERGPDGGLLVRGDGRETGAPVAAHEAADALVALAHWFVESGGAAAGRMARHAAPLPARLEGDRRPALPRPRLKPGAHALGAVHGLAFGTIAADRLAAATHGVAAIRVTPWRQLLLEGTEPGPIDGLIVDPADPALRVEACTGAPACAQASVATRPLALALAPLVVGTLHVSGCAKGCACARRADVMLTGRDGRFDLAYAARAGDPAAHAGLTPAQLLARFGTP